MITTCVAFLAVSQRAQVSRGSMGEALEEGADGAEHLSAGRCLLHRPEPLARDGGASVGSPRHRDRLPKDDRGVSLVSARRCVPLCQGGRQIPSAGHRSSSHTAQPGEAPAAPRAPGCSLCGRELPRTRGGWASGCTGLGVVLQALVPGSIGSAWEAQGLQALFQKPLGSGTPRPPSVLSARGISSL